MRTSIKYKTILLYLFAALFLLMLKSCNKAGEQTTNKSIQGTWVNINQFHPPDIMHFNEDFVTHNFGGYISKYLYIIYNDTLIIPGADFTTYKTKVQVSDTILKIDFYPLNQYSTKVYQRNTFGNYLDFMNHFLKMNVDLPVANYNKLDWRRINFPIFVNKTKSGKLEYFVGKKKIELVDTLNRFLHKNYSTQRAVCFIDKNILYKDLYPLQREIIESISIGTSFVIKNNQNELNSINVDFRDVIKPERDSQYYDYFIEFPKRVYDWKQVAKYGVVLKIRNNNIYYKERVISFRELEDLLDSKFRLNKQSHFFIHFGKHTLFDTYMRIITKLNSHMELKRNNFIKNKYYVDDYDYLDAKARREVDKHFLYKIDEITTTELNEYELESIKYEDL